MAYQPLISPFAEEAADRLVRELQCRNGLSSTWAKIPEIVQREIRRKFATIVDDAINDSHDDGF